MIQSPTMQEVRVESLERLETLEGRTRLSANAGSLSIVFSQEVWEVLSGRLGWRDVQTIVTGR
jgi:hypothetical protein